MILTNLNMVDIPYARKVSCARESKVIEVTHGILSSTSVFLTRMNWIPGHASAPVFAKSSAVLTIVCLLTTLAIGVLAFSAISDQLILIQQQHFSS